MQGKRRICFCGLSPETCAKNCEILVLCYNNNENESIASAADLMRADKY